MIYSGGKIIHCAKKLALQFGQINNNGQYINIKLNKYHVSEQMIFQDMEHAQIMGDDNVEVPQNDVGVFIKESIWW